MSRRAPSNGPDRAIGTLAIHLLFVGIFAFGCAGYHIGPVSKRSFNTIAVPMFRNDTLHPQLEAQISNAIIMRLQQDGSLRITDRSRADAVLSGTVLRYERTMLRSTQSDTDVPREFEVAITVRVEVKDRRTGEVYLRSTEVVGRSAVFIGEDQQTADEQVLPLVADDIGRKVAGLLTESWGEPR